MGKRKGTKGQTMIYKTLHRKVKIEQYELHKKIGVNTGALERGKQFLLHYWHPS